MARFLSWWPRFSRPNKYSIYFLNIAQFAGVLNDNIFKLVIAYLLIDIQGKEHAVSILSQAGAIFVIPFLLFSSAAGILADRFSKQRLLVAMKSVEIIIMLLAIVAFGVKSVWGSYLLLFLLSTHSALFGPSKYAIISELVPSERVSSANGMITSFTYLGVVIGTFFASFVTDIFNRNFIIVALFCLCIALVGCMSTLFIHTTPSQGSRRKINPFFPYEIYQTLLFCKTQRHLLLAMVGSAYFLFVGAFTQLNIIPFAIYSLKLSEIAGGYLFLATAVGIALGAYLGGKSFKGQVELGLSCIAGVLISILLLLLSCFAHHLIPVIILLICLGIGGGLFIVPLDSFVQLFSPNEKRGHIIATNNFLSFLGVLFASGMLYFCGQWLSFSPATGFVGVGILTLLFSIFMILRFSDLALPYISKHLIYLFRSLHVTHPELMENPSNVLLVLKGASWKKLLLLLTFFPSIHILFPYVKKRPFPWINGVFYSLHLMPLKSMWEKARELSLKKSPSCLFLPEGPLPSQPFSLFQSMKVIYVDVDIVGNTINFSRS